MKAHLLTHLIQATALLGLVSASEVPQLDVRQALSSLSSRTSSASARSAFSSVINVVTTSVFPGGVSPGTTTLESTLPLPCIDGCYNFAAPYAYCFLDATRPDQTDFSTIACPGLCNQTYYDGLSACLNCIIAHGGERPYGYSRNTSLTAYPSRTPAPSSENSLSATYRSIAEAQENPNGVLDLAQANGWLRNVSSYCGARGTSLAGVASVTAVATTTGPFAASWSSGETISRTAWTGLTQYPPPLYTYTETLRGGAVVSSSSGPTTSRSTSTPSVSPTGASSAAASQSSRAAGVESAQKAGGWVIGGALLAWAVM